MHPIRFRLYLDQELEVEDWLRNESDIVSTPKHHMKVALESGRDWMMEIYDPQKPGEEGYFRFGSHPWGRVEPRQSNGVGGN
jgi:hypothetical protein